MLYKNHKGKELIEKPSRWYSPKNILIGASIIYMLTNFNCESPKQYTPKNHAEEIKELSKDKKIYYSNEEIRKMFGPVNTKEDSILLEQLLGKKLEKIIK